MGTFSPRVRAVARHTCQRAPSRASAADAGFLDLRREATAQRKLQAMTDRSPQVQRLAQLQADIGRTSPSDAVIQRYVDIQGAGVFTGDDLPAFLNAFDEPTRTHMLRQIHLEGKSAKDRFPTMEAALQSPDRIMFGFNNNLNRYYLEFLEAGRQEVDGGVERFVGGQVSYAPRPQDGFEDLYTTGLNNCIAVVGETKDDNDRITGIAMTHFTTPQDIDPQTRTLTDHGLMVLNGFQARVPGGSVRLRWSLNSAGDSENHVSGAAAARLVAQVLTGFGMTIRSGASIKGDSCRYRLNNDGTADWV